MVKKTNIPNPTKLSKEEMEFLQDLTVIPNNKTKYKGRMISMSDEFYNIMNSYLRNNPTEGNRSSFIVRIVADYIKRNS